MCLYRRAEGLGEAGAPECSELSVSCPISSHSPASRRDRIVALAMRNKPSVDFCGYWQRGRSAS
jgi:hypothetical protein